MAARLNNYCRCRAFCIEDTARTGRTCKLNKRRSPGAQALMNHKPKIIPNKRRNPPPMEVE